MHAQKEPISRSEAKEVRQEQTRALKRTREEWKDKFIRLGESSRREKRQLEDELARFREERRTGTWHSSVGSGGGGRSRVVLAEEYIRIGMYRTVVLTDPTRMYRTVVLTDLTRMYRTVVLTDPTRMERTVVLTDLTRMERTVVLTDPTRMERTVVLTDLTWRYRTDCGTFQRDRARLAGERQAGTSRGAQGCETGSWRDPRRRILGRGNTQGCSNRQHPIRWRRRWEIYP